MLFYKETTMRSYRSGAKKILILTSLLTGLSLAGCGMAQGSLHAIAVTTNASAPTAVEGSTTPSDTTAPIIDALNVTIPYGTFLRLADIATITDDQDAFPTLELVSVSNMNEKPSQKTDVSKEGSTLPLAGTTASTSATALEAAEVEPDQTIDGRQYLLDAKDGHMITGWQYINGKTYYYSPNDGHMYHDWSTIDGAEYYFDKSDGHMYTGTHYVDGVEYNFGTTGVATKVAQQTRSNSSDTRSYSGYAYIGNSNSRKFHKASCSSVRDMRDYNKVGFDSRSEAIDAGYTPCKRCHP